MGTRTVVGLGLFAFAALAACGLSVSGSLGTGGGDTPDAGGAALPEAGVLPDGGAAGDAASPDAATDCYALQFDGVDDFVEVADAVDLDPTGPSTVEAWVRLTKDTADELHVVSHHDHFGTKGYLLMAFGYGDDGINPAELGGCTRYYDGQQMNQIGFGSGSLMPIDAWVHLAASYDGAALRVYVNGKKRDEKNSFPRHPNADFSGVLHIGRNALETNFAWGGLIDEVRISKTARYGSADFTPAARFDDDADTIALWHFDEGGGSVAQDVKGTHPGTLNGPVWVKTASCAAR